MPNPSLSFLTELLHNLGNAISSLTGWTQAAHEEARGARQAAERGNRGGAFDVLSGLPSGSGNARSITAMLSGMRTPPTAPRTQAPQQVRVLPQGTPVDDAAQGAPVDTMARSLGRMVGGIFRKLTGGSGSTAAGAGAVAGAGQTGMTGGLLVRGGTAALGVAGGLAAAPLTIGMSIFGVSRALQGFGERINEQSRYLRVYSEGQSVAFSSIERTKGMLGREKAGATQESLQRATKAQEEAMKARLPLDTMWTNVKNWASEKASKAAALGYSLLSAPFEASGYEKAAQEAAEAKKTPAQRERERLARMPATARMFEAFLRPDSLNQQLSLHHGMPAFGMLARQMKGMSDVMGLNPPHAGGAGAAFDAAQIAEAARQPQKLVAPGLMGPVLGNVEQLGRRRYRHKWTPEQIEKLKRADATKKRMQGVVEDAKLKKIEEAGRLAARGARRAAADVRDFMEGRRNRPSLLKPGENP